MRKRYPAGILASILCFISWTAPEARIFDTRMDYPVGEEPHSIAVEDLNGDNQPDLVAVNYYDHNVTALLGNWDGSFGSSRDFS